MREVPLPQSAISECTQHVERVYDPLHAESTRQLVNHRGSAGRNANPVPQLGASRGEAAGKRLSPCNGLNGPGRHRPRNLAAPDSLFCLPEFANRALLDTGREAIYNSTTALTRRVRDAVHPLFRVRGEGKAERPYLYASGVRIRIDGKTFLFSAAHGIADVDVEALQIPTPQHGVVPLGGIVLPTPKPPSKDREDDPLDVAVMELDAETAETLDPASALSADELDVDDPV